MRNERRKARSGRQDAGDPFRIEMGSNDDRYEIDGRDDKTLETLYTASTTEFIGSFRVHAGEWRN